MTWPADREVDLKYWNARLVWRLDEAVAIKNGIDPRIFITDDRSGDGYHVRGPKASHKEIPGLYRDLNDVCQMAENGVFPVHREGANADTPMFWTVKPEDFKKACWADSDNESPLGAKERNRLLIIIAALCKYASIDWTERGIAGRVEKIIADELATTVDDGTIKKALDKIPDVLKNLKK